MKPRFEKTLYVVLENEGTREAYLSAGVNFADYAVIGEKRQIAIYQLVKITTITAEAELKD